MFAYPPPLEEKKKDEAEKIETAVLSITNKKKQQLSTSAKKDDDVEQQPMDVTITDESGTTTTEATASAAAAAAKKDEVKKELEPNYIMLQNPARVVRLQLKCLTTPENSRYKPLKPLNHGGIIMLKDKRVDEEEEIVATVAAGGTTALAAAADTKEADAHATFEIVMADYWVLSNSNQFVFHQLSIDYLQSNLFQLSCFLLFFLNCDSQWIKYKFRAW